jgi:type II secretory pathway component GspD/PulD (secretin)
VPRWLLALALGSLIATSAAQDGELAIIPLQHRLVDELRPVLEPLLEAGGTLTGSGNQLILRTSPANLAELKQAIAALDVRLQRLRISVSQSRIEDSAFDAYGVGASVQGQTGGIAIGRPPGGPGVALDARVARTHGRDEGGDVRMVLTTDGQSAFINTGEAQATPYSNQAFTPYGPVIQEGIAYQQTSSGFYVTPRVHGDSVTLEISTQLERFARDGSGAIASSGVETTVTGRLGEWMPLGGAAETTASEQTGIVAHTRRRQHVHAGFWVRADRMP